jgi:polar amino acid transport system substrate-binding protein
MKITHKISLILISLICIFGHFFSPPSWVFAHEFLFKLTYVPIVLSALWAGRWFSLQLTTLFCLAYVFHIFIQLYHHPAHHHILSIVFELGIYFVVAWLTGSLSDHQRGISESLSSAYRDLKEKTKILVEFEERARKTERLRTMGELAGTVAHEIRTPLSGIQGAVEIITSSTSSDETKEKFSKTVFQEVERINGVVENFLKLGREGKPEKEELNLRKFIDESTTLLEPVLKKKNIKLDIHIDQTCNIFSNNNQLKQVIINLVMNAYYACDQHDGVIRIYSDDPYDSLSVTDNGKGIDESFEEQLFQPFESNRDDGNGLGLYLSRNIIKSLGGDLILLKSEPGNTTFQILWRGEDV